MNERLDIPRKIFGNVSMVISCVSNISNEITRLELLYAVEFGFPGWFSRK